MKRKWLILTISLMFVIAMALAGCGSADSADSDGTAAADADIILSAVPELEPFIGGWGYQSAPTECSTAYFFEENGQLEVVCAQHHGGGYEVMFDPGDISFDGDIMTCKNGYLLSEGGTATDAELVATPVKTEPGAYFFVLTSQELEWFKGDQSWCYHYLKVAENEEELYEWIDENVPDL